MSFRNCRYCHKEYPMEMLVIVKRGCPQCPECTPEVRIARTKEKDRIRRENNRERERERWRTYYAEHREEIRARKNEYNKTYNQIELTCDVCECQVRKCNWSRHSKTQKHNDNLECKRKEEEKMSKMNEEELDEYIKIKKLKKIWKTVRL